MKHYFFKFFIFLLLFFTIINVCLAENTTSIDFELDNAQYLSLVEATKGSDYTEYTIEAWITPESLPAIGDYAIIWQEYSADMKGFFGLYNDGGTQKIKGGGEFTVGGWVTTEHTITLTTGSCYHLRFTWEGTGGPIRIYLNQVDVANSANTNGAPVHIADGLAVSYFHGVGWYFDGEIDDLRIWSVDRGADFSDIGTELDGDEANLVAYYDFTNNANDSCAVGGNDNLTENNNPTYTNNVCFLDEEAYRDLDELPTDMPYFDDLSIISHKREILEKATSTPLEYEYRFYHVPFIVWAIFYLLIVFIFTPILIEFIIRWRK